MQPLLYYSRKVVKCIAAVEQDNINFSKPPQMIKGRHNVNNNLA